MFYSNINTKCFFSTSNIFLCIFCVVFEFLILFVLFLHKFSIEVTMDPSIKLTNSLALLNQQLGMWQMANEYHQRVTNRVRNPHMHMAQVRYGGTSYWNNYNPS